jgi:ABC-2 type transport system ATP-binding protein
MNSASVQASIHASNLSKSFGAKPVLQDLSFDVAQGDVIGVLGKNGAGKTTLLELMLGFTAPSAGAVRVFGHESHRLPGGVKARVGFVPQQDELLDTLTVRDQIKVIASFYSKWDSVLIDRLCAEWGIDTHARIKSMSVGERQKLSIVLAFGHRPDLLILDEPVASLDPMARRQFLEKLVELSTEGERAVVFSSHIVSDIERLANRIWILKEGRLDWQGDLDSLKESIVRLHLRTTQRLPETLPIPGLLSMRREGNFATAVVRDWTAAAREDLVRRIGGQVEVEPLGLEEIFLELHR